MEFKQLQSFSAVVKYRSFTKAAEKLYTSQPTISTHIRQLEEELHFRLIVRTTKNIEITPRGQELYEFASHVLSLRDDLVKRWSIERNQHVIRIGASTIPSTYILPELLPAYRKEHSDIQFNIHQSDSESVINSLLQGDLEVGLVGMNNYLREITFLPIYKDSMVLITPVTPKYMQFKEQNGDIRELLLHEPILLRELTGNGRKYIESYFEQIHLPEADLNVTARLNDQESIKQLVASGLGISIISRKAAENFEKLGKVLVFDLPNQKDFRTIYLAYRTDFILKVPTQQFISFGQNYYKGQHLLQPELEI